MLDCLLIDTHSAIAVVCSFTHTYKRFLFKIDQDFTMIFGEEVSGKFLSKWPTFFKPRVIADCCKNLTPSPHVDELLLSAQQESDDGGKC